MHSEMNWDLVTHWYVSKVSPKFASGGRKDVVALDRSTYHTALDDKYRRPCSSWNNH